MEHISSILHPTFPLLSSCSPIPASQKAFSEFGAGFRFSIYGPDYNSGSAYLALVTKEMTRKFPSSDPMDIWIIGKINGNKAYLNFPGTSDDPNIIFGETDDNEAFLTYYDKHNVQVWLQI
jgi:hypothetical protein